MKKLTKIKLNHIGQDEMKRRELKGLVGGCSGDCGCRDDSTNAVANYKQGFHTAGEPCTYRVYGYQYTVE